jgi:hypothetical protein
MRTLRVADLLLRGYSIDAVYKIVTAPLKDGKGDGWELKKRQLYNYATKARRLIRDSSEYDRALEVGKAIQRLESLYRLSFGIQDYKTCLAVQRELSILLGLTAEDDLQRRFLELEEQAKREGRLAD